MNALLLIVMLSNQGYWIAGTEGVVRVGSVLQNPGNAGIPAGDFVWGLSLNGVRLAGGKTPLDPAGGETRIRIVCPEVRTRVPLRLSWRMVGRDGREISSGASVIEAFPADLTRGWAGVVGNRRLVVVDPEGGLSKLLALAKVPHVRVRITSRLQLEKAAMVIVAPDALAGGLFEQPPLIALARSGASVMVLRQTRVDTVAGLPLVLRGKSKRLLWDQDHPLLERFTEQDLTRWAEGWPGELLAVRPPAQGRVNPVIQWPVEAQGGASPAWPTPAARLRTPVEEFTPGGAVLSADALLVVQPAGRGRLVVCQLPLGDWETDPRCQLFLGAALDYLTTRPATVAGPTTALPAEGRRDLLPVIPIRPGDRP